MRTCKNCVFSVLADKNEWCMRHGTLCRIAVGSPNLDRCDDHQYPEKEIKQVLDEAVNLLDSFMITMSEMHERRVKRLVGKRDEMFS